MTKQNKTQYMFLVEKELCLSWTHNSSVKERKDKFLNLSAVAGDFFISISCVRLKVNRSKGRLWAIIKPLSSLFCGCRSFWIFLFLNHLLWCQKRLEHLHHKLWTCFKAKNKYKNARGIRLMWKCVGVTAAGDDCVGVQLKRFLVHLSTEDKAENWSSEYHWK